MAYTTRLYTVLQAERRPYERINVALGLWDDPSHMVSIWWNREDFETKHVWLPDAIWDECVELWTRMQHWQGSPDEALRIVAHLCPHLHPTPWHMAHDARSREEQEIALGQWLL